MNRRLIVMIGIAAIAAPLLALWGFGGAPADDDGVPSGTEVVVQWPDDGPSDSSTRAEPVLDLLDTRSQGLYVVDSFDLGGGTMNVFLYADDPERAARRVIQLLDEGLLPQDMRIGIANAQEDDPASRTYRPIYPAGLTEFRLIYPSANALRNRGG